MTLNPITGEPQLRECPACGNSTPAASPTCAFCGALFAEADLAARETAKEDRFLRALFTRSNPFTMIFIGVNVGVFVLIGNGVGVRRSGVGTSVFVGVRVGVGVTVAVEVRVGVTVGVDVFVGVAVAV